MTDTADPLAAARRVLQEMDPEADHVYTGQGLYAFETDVEAVAWALIAMGDSHDSTGAEQWCLRNARPVDPSGYALYDEYGRHIAHVTDPETAIRIVRAMRGICTRVDRANADLLAAGERETRLREDLEYINSLVSGGICAVGHKGKDRYIRLIGQKVDDALAPSADRHSSTTSEREDER